MTPPTPYQSLISPRSRRIRTIGCVLLCMAALMALIGRMALMPAIDGEFSDRSVHSASSVAGLHTRRPAAGLTPAAGLQETRAQKLRKLRAAVALAYWGVCFLLILAALSMAWLDLRETSRNYLAQRHALSREVAQEFRADLAERDKTGRADSPLEPDLRDSSVDRSE